MKTSCFTRFAGFVALLLAGPLVGAADDAPAPVTSADKLYVTIDYTDPVQFERMRYSRLTQQELIVSTLKNTAATQAAAAGYAGEVTVLDENSKAPEGATVMSLTWGTSSGVTVDLTQGGRKKFLGVARGTALAFHPDHDRMQRRLDRALMPDAHRDEALRVATELELYYALRNVVKHQQSQKRE